MSRGHWNYRNEELANDIFGWRGSERKDFKGNAPDVFEDQEISNLIWDVFDLLYAADSFFCGDWGSNSYEETLNDFKKCWFKSKRTDRLKQIIDDKLESAKKELYKVAGVELNAKDGKVPGYGGED